MIFDLVVLPLYPILYLFYSFFLVTSPVFFLLFWVYNLAFYWNCNFKLSFVSECHYFILSFLCTKVLKHIWKHFFAQKITILQGKGNVATWKAIQLGRKRGFFDYFFQTLFPHHSYWLYTVFRVECSETQIMHKLFIIFFLYILKKKLQIIVHHNFYLKLSLIFCTLLV